MGTEHVNLKALKAQVDEGLRGQPFPRPDITVTFEVAGGVVLEAQRMERALEALGRERNDWARQMADLRDEFDAAVTAREKAESERGEASNEIVRRG